MRNTFRVVGVLVALVATASLLAGCGSGKRIAGAGSDTTFDVMNALTNQYNNDGSSGDDTAHNIPPVLASGNTYTVPGDGDCGTRTYGNGDGQTPPPNGSSAGIAALLANSGCTDFARSSSGRGSEPSNIEFYAYARDAVTWARFGAACPGGDAGPAGCAPTNLTVAQLKGIFICDQAGGLPKFTNWAQVGGDNEPIRRYLPQINSGTGNFFQSRVLGLSSSQRDVVTDQNCAASSKPARVQENAGTTVNDSERARAILPYSFAQWRAQASGVVNDLRNGALLANINGVAPSQTSVSNGTFLGVRYVYNVVDNTGPTYARTMNFVGVRPGDQGGNGFICANTTAVQNAISNYGFVPLSQAPAGPGLPNSRCRKNPPPL